MHCIGSALHGTLRCKSGAKCTANEHIDRRADRAACGAINRSGLCTAWAIGAQSIGPGYQSASTSLLARSMQQPRIGKQRLFEPCSILCKTWCRPSPSSTTPGVSSWPLSLTGKWATRLPISLISRRKWPRKSRIWRPCTSVVGCSCAYISAYCYYLVPLSFVCAC